ncbi:MAG: 2-oxo acid dehydrogenase subunit E2 [Anaerolineae bacterium]|nr:2-oxo acid dehydrogenase subunit E2 [Anaerolineae bacterium]
MAKELFIPQMGQTVEEVRLVRWLVGDGTKVEEGQEILEVETDKAIFAVAANATGTLHLGPYKEDDAVPVLTVVGIIGKPEEKFAVKGKPEALTLPPTPSLSEGEGRGVQLNAPTTGANTGAPILFASPRARKLATDKDVDLAQVTPTGGGGQRVAERDVIAYLSQLPKATPVAQKMAAEAGMDVRTLSGSGPGGMITKEDVERAVQKPALPPIPPPAPLPEVEVTARVPLKGVRGIIAERMGTSAHTTARVTLLMEADATEFVAMRERLKTRVADEWGFAPGYNDLLAKMATTALRKFPYMNARLAADAVEHLAHVNIGMAVDTERGLLVPVIREADKKSLRQFATEFRELVERAHKGRSLPDDLKGGTFTITNLGMYDVLAFTPIINLPEAAILGVGVITQKPVVREGEVVVRQMLMLSLAFDHRLVDGAPAARFLQYLKDLIEEPYLWLAV